MLRSQELAEERVDAVRRGALHDWDRAGESASEGEGDCGAGPLAASRAVVSLAGAGGEPVREFRLLPFGRVSLDRPLAGRDTFEFLPRHARSAVAWFERVGRKLAVDYEHQSLDAAARTDGLRPAAGWIGGLEVREDGLWATNVQWTSRAAELLRSGEYRYFSPVIYWTDESYSDVAALGPVALTNDPALHKVPALAAGRGHEGKGRRAGPVDGSKTPGHGPGFRDHRPDTQEVDAEAIAPETVTVEALMAARREVETLREALRKRDADAFVARGEQLGKIVAATRDDWREDYLRDALAAEARLDRAPVILPPGRLMRGDRVGGFGGSLNAAGTVSLARTGRGSAEVDPEDLAAYERALAAGRVVRVSAARG